ncbi:hypothetical protein IWQ61_001002 [Dispira simplex]|nr:hypothetical protein IWQ61_001002 [Dispira simplex]
MCCVDCFGTCMLYRVCRDNCHKRNSACDGCIQRLKKNEAYRYHQSSYSHPTVIVSKGYNVPYYRQRRTLGDRIKKFFRNLCLMSY